MMSRNSQKVIAITNRCYSNVTFSSRLPALNLAIAKLDTPGFTQIPDFAATFCNAPAFPRYER